MTSLDDPGVRALIGRSMIAEVATLSPKKRPFVTPLWFVLDGGAFYITTGPGTRAGKNIQQHPGVTLLFCGDAAADWGEVLRVRGTAACHHGLPSWRVLLRIAAKYYVSPWALRAELLNWRKWSLRTRYYGQVKGGFGHIRVVPSACEFLRRP